MRCGIKYDYSRKVSRSRLNFRSAKGQSKCSILTLPLRSLADLKLLWNFWSWLSRAFASWYRNFGWKVVLEVHIALQSAFQPEVRISRQCFPDKHWIWSGGKQILPIYTMSNSTVASTIYTHKRVVCGIIFRLSSKDAPNGQFLSQRLQSVKWFQDNAHSSYLAVRHIRFLDIHVCVWNALLIVRLAKLHAT